MFRFAPLVTVVLAKDKYIELTWTDCGSDAAHAKITSLVPTPDPLPLGFDNPGKIAATGTLDKDEEGGSYNIKVKVLGQTITDETADFCQPFSFDIKFLGQRIGHADVEAMDCPAPAGELTFNLGLQLTSVVPAGVGGATISLSGTDQDGEELTCLNIDAKIKKGEEMSV